MKNAAELLLFEQSQAAVTKPASSPHVPISPSRIPISSLSKTRSMIPTNQYQRHPSPPKSVSLHSHSSDNIYQAQSHVHGVYQQQHQPQLPTPPQQQHQQHQQQPSTQRVGSPRDPSRF